MTSQLFDKSEFMPEPAPPSKPPGPGRPRLRCAVRDQIVMHCEAVDDLIPVDHPARLIWKYVDGLDLSPLLDQFQAVEGEVGRAGTDPRILMTLWLYATIEGVGSARELDRLCQHHSAYKWICGGVSLNYHTLADFRVEHEAFLDTLLTQSVAALMSAGVVELKRIAQDGMRVRASAGTSSFRRRPTLERLLEEAREQVQALKAEIEADPAGGRRRQKAAQKRGAEEREKRVQEALAELAKIEAKKPAAEKAEARASTTDPQARRMKMACGGFRPAYNLQFATDTATQVIVGVDLINVGSDKGQMRPMHEQLKRRYGRTPQEYLADGDFAYGEDIEHLQRGETTVYTPPKKTGNPNRSPDEPVAGDSAILKEWRRRMASPQAQLVYRDRAASAECVNAHARNRGLQQFPVRGPTKTRLIGLWYALAQNLMRTFQLLPSFCT
jgi:transposase